MPSVYYLKNSLQPDLKMCMDLLAEESKGNRSIRPPRYNEYYF